LRAGFVDRYLLCPSSTYRRTVGVSTLQRNDQGQGRVFGAGLTMAVSVGVFAYGGLWLDARFGTKPWLLLLCVFCGIVGGILHLILVLAPELWPFGRLPKSPDRS
jgi:F0F1-type ATP synthase assembly protein I